MNIVDVYVRNIRFVNILFRPDESCLYEHCTSTQIPKGDPWTKLFYELKNNPTKFVYNYTTNKHDTLWNKLNA